MLFYVFVFPSFFVLLIRWCYFVFSSFLNIHLSYLSKKKKILFDVVFLEGKKACALKIMRDPCQTSSYFSLEPLDRLFAWRNQSLYSILDLLDLCNVLDLFTPVHFLCTWVLLFCYQYILFTYQNKNKCIVTIKLLSFLLTILCLLNT